MPETTIVKTEVAGGYIYTTDQSGNRTRHTIAPLAANVPDLTISSLSLLTMLAQVVIVVVQTLIEQEIIDEELVASFNLQYVFERLINDLGAEAVL